MKNTTSLSRYALYGLSCLLLVTAILIWNDRMARARQLQSRQELAQQQQRTQRAVALLYRALQAESDLTYAARSHTTVVYGDRKVQNVAQLVQAPDNLSIKYLDGDYKGMQCGYSGRWFYRQCHDDKRMAPYAEVQHKPGQIAARQFALLLKNYHAEWVKDEKLQNRAVEVVQILPARSIAGASGPAQRLWIDSETGLPLRVEWFDYQLRPILDTSLSDIDFSPQITPATFKPPAQIREMTKTEPWITRDLGQDRAAVEKITGLIAPRANYLPPGFVFDHVGVHWLDALKGPRIMPPRPQDYAALTRYTDGLNALTLFALRRVAQKEANQAATDCNFGPGTLVMREVKGGTIVAVADLPPAVLHRVLDSAPKQILR